MSIDGPAPDAFDMVVENAAACALSLFIRLKVLRWLSKSSPRLCWLRSWPWRRLSPRTGCLRTDTDEFFKNTAWNNKIRGECLTTRQFFSHTVQGELSSSWKSISEALHSYTRYYHTYILASSRWKIWRRKTLLPQSRRLWTLGHFLGAGRSAVYSYILFPSRKVQSVCRNVFHMHTRSEGRSEGSRESRRHHLWDSCTCPDVSRAMG